MSPIWKSLSRSATSQPRRSCFRGGLPAFHGCYAFSSSAMSNPYDENEEMPTAPSEKVLKIVEDISGLTLLEAADMSLLLKKKLRIQNVPVMSMGMNVMHDMWYETLPPPIGPKRMIPSRNFGDAGRPSKLSRRESKAPLNKVDNLAEYMRSASEDSDDATGEYANVFRPGFGEGEGCLEFGDEEESGKLTRKGKAGSKASGAVEGGGSTRRQRKKDVDKVPTTGAIPASAKPAAKKKSSTNTKKETSDEKNSVAEETTAPAAKTTRTPKTKTTKAATGKMQKAKPGTKAESAETESAASST